MDLFLIHCLVLTWASIGAARRLAAQTADLILAAALLAWANLVVTGLLLSGFGKLGQPAWFFCSSLLLATLTFMLMLRVPPETPAGPPVGGSGAEKSPPWLLAAFVLILLPLALGCIGIAWTYAPNNADALSTDLPRVMYYLGQNSLTHFAAADPRQIYRPFNYTLLQLFGSIYAPPLQCLNVFNLAAWALGGLGVHRLCRLLAGGAAAALLTCLLALTATAVVAQAGSTTSELPSGAALVCAVAFALKWRQTGRARDAALAGLAAGLAAGSNLGIIFLGFIAGLFGMIQAYRRWRRAGRAVSFANLRPWLFPGLLAGAIGAPFALINLVEEGHWLAPAAGSAFKGSAPGAAGSAWTGFLPLLGNPAPLLALNEDIAGFGLAGLLSLACAIVCLTRSDRSAAAARVAGLGLSGIFVTLMLHRWLPGGIRDFMPAFLLLAPCVAPTIGTGRSGWRNAGGFVVVVVALAGAWSSGVYLLRNSSRPVMPLLNAAFAPPALPALPLLVEHRLSHQTWISIDTDGADEAIFPLLALGRHQRFTSPGKIEPEAYNLISRAESSRHAAYSNPALAGAYTFLSLPGKRTGGVEFLATIGSGTAARDYFGLEPRAGRAAPIDSNRNLLVTLYHEPRQSRAPDSARLKVAGLNPEDYARLVVTLEYADGRTEPAASFTQDGETVFPIAHPFHRLGLKVLDDASGAELGASAIHYLPQAAADSKPIDPAQPTGANSIFVTDLVLAKTSPVTASDGLQPTEGPFPQWDIPFIRWAKQPSVSLRLPAIANLARVQLSFSVRLHVREKAGLDVFWNGALVRHFRIEGQTTWLDQTLDLAAHPGENVVEFRDAPLPDEPDWQDYLARYPDVKKFLEANGIPPESGAREHYEKVGRTEGRTVARATKPSPAPDSFYFMFRNIRLEGFKSP